MQFLVMERYMYKEPKHIVYCFVVCCCCLQVSKDAKECMQECVSEFISFITSE